MSQRKKNASLTRRWPSSPPGAMVPIFAKWRLTDISSTPTPRRSRRLPRSFPSSVGISIRSQSGSTPEIPSIKRIWRKSDQYSVVMWRTVCPPIFCTASITSDLHFKSFSSFYHSIYYSAINLSNQVSMTIINWLTPFHSCSISSRVLCFTYFCTYTQVATLLA